MDNIVSGREALFDRVLLAISKAGSTEQRSIPGYTDEIGEYLQSLGYISITGPSGVWECIEITNEGRGFIREGGFSSQKERREEQIHDRSLNNENSKASIRTNKRATMISIAVVVITAIGVIISCLGLF